MNFEINIEGSFNFRTVKSYDADSLEEAMEMAHNDDFDPISTEITNTNINEVSSYIPEN